MRVLNTTMESTFVTETSSEFSNEDLFANFVVKKSLNQTKSVDRITPKMTSQKEKKNLIVKLY